MKAGKWLVLEGERRNGIGQIGTRIYTWSDIKAAVFPFRFNEILAPVFVAWSRVTFFGLP